MPLASAGSDHDPPPPAASGPFPGDVVPTEQTHHEGPALSEAAEAQAMAAESMQRIHHGAYELLRFSEIFPGGTTSMSSQGEAAEGNAALAGPSSSHAALMAMAKSSDGIVSEIRHMTALAARAEGGAGVSFNLPPATGRDTNTAPHGKRPHSSRRASGDMSSQKQHRPHDVPRVPPRRDAAVASRSRRAKHPVQRVRAPVCQAPGPPQGEQQGEQQRGKSGEQQKGRQLRHVMAFMRAGRKGRTEERWKRRRGWMI